MMEFLTYDYLCEETFGVSHYILIILTELTFQTYRISFDSKISVLERVGLTLCKLCLNLSFDRLSRLFGFDMELSVSYFQKTVSLLAGVLKCTICWLSKEEVEACMPLCFKNFQGTRVVLHRFELTVDVSDCNMCQTCESSCGRSLTLSVMVGIAPSGLISYVSKICSNEVSDAQIFGDSGLIDRCSPFLDTIMVVNDFRIARACDAVGIKLHSVALSAADMQVDLNAPISSAKTLISSIICRLLKFAMIEDKLPWHCIPKMHDVITVAAGLVNLTSQIKFSSAA